MMSLMAHEHPCQQENKQVHRHCRGGSDKTRMMRSRGDKNNNQQLARDAQGNEVQLKKEVEEEEDDNG